MQLPIGKKTIDNIGIDIDIAVAEKNESMQKVQVFYFSKILDTFKIDLKW